MDVDSEPTTYALPPPSIPETPIAIDNGATTLRYGFCTSAAPRSALNDISKYKERRTNKPLLLLGDAVDVEGVAKIQARTPWEGDVLLYFDALLEIDASTVDHLIIMSERLCSPMYSRSMTSELLFEQYRAPSVTYCVDSVMSFYQNHGPNNDGLVLSFNTASTSVIPVLAGKGILSHAKRIPWGASQSADYLLKLVQLKYTNFPTRVLPAQTQWMLHNFCEFAVDYPTHIRSLNSISVLQGADRIVQFPYALHLAEEKSPEELERIAERRREQGKKLQEMAAKMRTEKLLKKEKDLQYLLNLREGKAEDSKREWTTEDFDNDAVLDNVLERLETDFRKACKKEAADDETVEEPTYPFLEVPDGQLDEEGLKEKKK
ncbi:hypothetical protein HMN09_00644700 [Mycena chlorophos]|uniref:Uncharacterized protein n=1 Tax=Mycena chlorophos TaxID=658473 RepID=A0A8H6WDP1_MYCCL|nr:hypothetical protein HMN09_00644700 [Mycena chlorophos]